MNRKKERKKQTMEGGDQKNCLVMKNKRKRDTRKKERKKERESEAALSAGQ